MVSATGGRETKRLRWLCRRGMKELDVLLSHYFETRYGQVGASEQAAFARLLACQDPVLYALILGEGEADDPGEARVLADLRRYAEA